jgi:uncharacterized RDD family membrane protein YckC
MSSWYFVKDGQRNGPMRREELDARIAEGVVDGGTLVWRVGLAAWEKASSLPELGLPPPARPPALPPPLSSAPAAGETEAEGVERAETREDFPRARSYAPSAGPGWEAGSAAAAPSQAMARAARSRAPVFAGFRIRLAAKAIDWVVLYGIGTLAERLVVAFAFDGVAPAAADWPGMWRLLMYTGTINTVIAIIYHVYFMATYEATPGKRVLGLRLVRADGRRLGTGRVIARYFAEALSTMTFLAGYVMAAFDDEKRTLHDYICDTRVVRGPREESRWDELRR